MYNRDYLLSGKQEQSNTINVSKFISATYQLFAASLLTAISSDFNAFWYWLQDANKTDTRRKLKILFICFTFNFLNTHKSIPKKATANLDIIYLL